MHNEPHPSTTNLTTMNPYFPSNLYPVRLELAPAPLCTANLTLVLASESRTSDLTFVWNRPHLGHTTKLTFVHI